MIDTTPEFADMTTIDLRLLQRFLDHSVYEEQCYSLDDLSYLFRVNDELERREKQEDENE